MGRRTSLAYPFWLAAALLIGASLRAPSPTLGFAGLVIACVFLVLPSLLAARARAVGRLGTVLRKLEERSYDLDSVRREHRKALTASQAVSEQLAELLESSQQLQQARADLTRSEQRHEQLVNCLSDYVDGLSRGLAFESLHEEYREALHKSREELRQTLLRLDIELVLPQPGEPLHEGLHMAVGKAPGGSPGTVVLVRRSGLRVSGVVRRRAEVIVAEEAQ